MKKMMSKEDGFTLVELLIVVIILGVLAAVAIPQFSSSTDDAKVATLDSSLGSLRNAVELYLHQHNSVYPGAIDTDGVTLGTAGTCPNAFASQLTLYTDVTGQTSQTKNPAFPYGPYIKKGALPTNPFNDLASVVCDLAETDVTVAGSSGVGGWKFYTVTGRLIANDGAHDSN